MSSFPMYRARSIASIPNERSIVRDGKVGTLTRVSSVPNLDALYPSDRYRPSTMFKYRRDRDLIDDHWSDRVIYHSPIYMTDYRYMARRQLYTDPIPKSLGFEYPAFWSRYKWYTDWLNPTYWRRYRDPQYDRPLWNYWQPWRLDRINTKRAVRMYREGLLDFKTLDKHWIEPSALGRKSKDWTDVYTPAVNFSFYDFYKYAVRTSTTYSRRR